MVMALIYVKCGQNDKAISQLEELLAQQTNYTINDFRMHMEFEPLWKLPRYQEMIKKHAR
jgi:hypothetical protein